METHSNPPVYVLLAPVPDADDPRRHCPRAFVVVNRADKWEVHTVYPPDRQALGSRAAANAVMLPAAQKWLRQRGWRTYDVFVPQGSSSAGGEAPPNDGATQASPQPLTLPSWR